MLIIRLLSPTKLRVADQICNLKHHSLLMLGQPVLAPIQGSRTATRMAILSHWYDCAMKPPLGLQHFIQMPLLPDQGRGLQQHMFITWYVHVHTMFCGGKTKKHMKCSCRMNRHTHCFLIPCVLVKVPAHDVSIRYQHLVHRLKIASEGFTNFQCTLLQYNVTIFCEKYFRKRLAIKNGYHLKKIFELF